MQILITGATGFVGRAMRAFDYHPLFFDAARTTNLSHLDYATQGWDNLQWDYIVHLAPTSPERVIKCAKQFGTRVLFASSGAAAHPTPNAYGLMKIEHERMLMESGIECVIARIYTTCGPHMNWNGFAIGNFIRDAFNGGPILILGDGKTVRSYMYASDLANWLWNLLLFAPPRVPFDVGSPFPVSIAQLAEEVGRNFREKPAIVIKDQIMNEQARYYVPQGLQATYDAIQCPMSIEFRHAVRYTVCDYMNEHAQGMAWKLAV